MRLRAPEGRVYNRARLNWLLKQLPEVENDDINVRCHSPRPRQSLNSLAALRADPAQIDTGKGRMKVFAFEVILATDLGRRFDQRRNFIDELERAVPAFYMEVGQHLKAWHAPPPRVISGREDASKVTPAAIAEDAEERPMNGQQVAFHCRTTPIDCDDCIGRPPAFEIPFRCKGFLTHMR